MGEALTEHLSRDCDCVIVPVPRRLGFSMMVTHVETLTQLLDPRHLGFLLLLRKIGIFIIFEELIFWHFCKEGGEITKEPFERMGKIIEQ